MIYQKHIATSTSEKKMHHFCHFSTAAVGQNGYFQTFLDFEKTWVLWDLLIVFSKYFTKGFIWAKYEEIENFETGAGFSIFTDLTYV